MISNLNECELFSRKIAKYLMSLLILERERIVDVGFLGNWWFTNKAMEEYDVNQDEWDESGNPIDTKDQLKPLW